MASGMFQTFCNVNPNRMSACTLDDIIIGIIIIIREALHVYATAGGTASRVGATVPTVDPE
jgi:hypothetical protein